ncbi:MAG: hypothetical protein GC182_14850 [Rhodopseudomonas sp.]|nr:hypothetical protein [Rhodopseudomonas sp.]
MTSSPDPAHILFPGDAPRPTEPPQYFKAELAAAEARLMGSQKLDPAGKENAAPAGPNAAEATNDADKLFSSEVKPFDGAVVDGFLDQHVLSAISDGDTERADALKHATAALTDDFSAAGTNSDDVKEAFDLLRSANDHMVPPPPEQIEADMTANLAALQGELGQTFESDLTAARAFIRDLEKVAPGTVASLEHNGAGNDTKLVKAAIREALRRGYGSRR